MKEGREKSRSFLFIIHSDILDYYNNQILNQMKLDLSTITITEISCLKFLKKSKYKDKNHKKALTN